MDVFWSCEVNFLYRHDTIHERLGEEMVECFIELIIECPPLLDKAIHDPQRATGVTFDVFFVVSLKTVVQRGYCHAMAFSDVLCANSFRTTMQLC